MYLTPTEDLVIETLVARHRLGETLWTFESRHKKTLNSLADKGLVNIMHGIVEKSVRASLTTLGIKTYISEKYRSPLERKLEQAQVEAKYWLDAYGRTVGKS